MCKIKEQDYLKWKVKSCQSWWLMPVVSKCLAICISSLSPCDKMMGINKDTFILDYSSRGYIQGQYGSKSRRQYVTLHAVKSLLTLDLKVLSSLSPFYSERDPSPRNDAIHLEWVFRLQLT